MKIPKERTESKRITNSRSNKKINNKTNFMIIEKKTPSKQKAEIRKRNKTKKEYKYKYKCKYKMKRKNKSKTSQPSILICNKMLI